MTTETLESRIREKARKELESEISNAFHKVEKLANFTHVIETDLVNSNLTAGTPYMVHELVDAIKRALLKRRSPSREEAAVSDFLAKVESLQGEIEQLRAEVSGA